MKGQEVGTNNHHEEVTRRDGDIHNAFATTPSHLAGALRKTQYRGCSSAHKSQSKTTKESKATDAKFQLRSMGKSRDAKPSRAGYATQRDNLSRLALLHNAGTEGAKLLYVLEPKVLCVITIVTGLSGRLFSALLRASKAESDGGHSEFASVRGS